MSHIENIKKSIAAMPDNEVLVAVALLTAKNNGELSEKWYEAIKYYQSVGKFLSEYEVSLRIEERLGDEYLLDEVDDCRALLLEEWQRNTEQI